MADSFAPVTVEGILYTVGLDGEWEDRRWEWGPDGKIWWRTLFDYTPRWVAEGVIEEKHSHQTWRFRFWGRANPAGSSIEQHPILHHALHISDRYETIIWWKPGPHETSFYRDQALNWERLPEKIVDLWAEKLLEQIRSQPKPEIPQIYPPSISVKEIAALGIEVAVSRQRM